MWGFNNIVWSRDISLPIIFSLDYTYDENKIEYSFVITGAGNGKLTFIDEKLSISNYLDIHREFNDVYYKYDHNFSSKLDDDRVKILIDRFSHEERHDKIKSGLKLFLDDGESTLNNPIWSSRTYPKSVMSVLFSNSHNPYTDNIQANILFSPHSNKKNFFRTGSLYSDSISFLSNPNQIILLRQLNYNVIRQPPPTNKPSVLQEDGDGLINLLFQWYSQEGNRLPDIFELALEELFPNWQLSFTVTDDGRILMQIQDDQMILSPPSIPDGFYKLLTILAAIELNPHILLIDELETSLHAKIIDYVISSLKISDSNVIITTHSPTVIDTVDLEDIITIEKAGYESICSRIENPDDLKLELKDKGITASDSWIYGDL